MEMNQNIESFQQNYSHCATRNVLQFACPQNDSDNFFQRFNLLAYIQESSCRKIFSLINSLHYTEVSLATTWLIK
jgi:hypothetical protein